MDSHGHLNVLSGHRHDCQVQKRAMEVHKTLGLNLFLNQKIHLNKTTEFTEVFSFKKTFNLKQFSVFSFYLFANNKVQSYIKECMEESIKN